MRPAVEGYGALRSHKDQQRVSCLPLTREVDFAKQKTEGEITSRYSNAVSGALMYISIALLTVLSQLLFCNYYVALSLPQSSPLTVDASSLVRGSPWHFPIALRTFVGFPRRRKTRERAPPRNDPLKTLLHISYFILHISNYHNPRAALIDCSGKGIVYVQRSFEQREGSG